MQRATLRPKISCDTNPQVINKFEILVILNSLGNIQTLLISKIRSRGDIESSLKNKKLRLKENRN